MDYEKLIEQLRDAGWTNPGVTDKQSLEWDAADALSALQTENERLRAEVERQKGSADNRQHLYENAERAYMKVLAELEQKSKLIAQQAAELERRDKLLKEQESELEQAKQERDKLERFLGELEGAVYTGQYFHLRPMIEKWHGLKED